MSEMTCPACAMSIPRAANLCPYCRSDLGEFKYQEAKAHVRELRREEREERRTASRARTERINSVIMPGFPLRPTILTGIALAVVSLGIVFDPNRQVPFALAVFLPLLALFAPYLVVYFSRWQKAKDAGEL